MKYASSLLLVLTLLAVEIFAQGGGQTLFGDLKIDEREAPASASFTFQVLLYSEAGGLLARLTVSSNGRYRFLNLANGNYQVAVEFENREVARVPVYIHSPFKTDFRQDIELRWESLSRSVEPGVISAADYYERPGGNKALFRQASEDRDKKHYLEAIASLEKIVARDERDFPAWEALGTNHFILKDFNEAEKCYSKALALRPDYEPALLNQGRLRIVVKDLNGAIDVLSHALKVEPSSASANYFLGEAYLQARLGSKAVPYLNEAIRLDPVGMADAHLRLAALYNARGLKTQAAQEYVQFLKQRPDYPDKKKLEAFIAANK